MTLTTTLLILICFSLTVTEGRYNSKRTNFPEPRLEGPPLRRLMIINNEGYKLSDQARNRVWDLYKNNLGRKNAQKNLLEVEYQEKNAKPTNSQDLHLTDLTITQAGGIRGLQVSTSRDLSSRLGLAAPPSANSVIWTPSMTPRKAPSADDPSINEVDSADFPSHNVNKSTTYKPNILWGIVPGPNNRVWDLNKNKSEHMNPQKHLLEVENQEKIAKSTNSQDLHLTNLTITQADGITGLQVSTARDPSSSLGLAAPPSANSVKWNSIMTPRKAPRADDPSINVIDSGDLFPSHNVNRSTTTYKPNILWGIVPGPNNRVWDLYKNKSRHMNPQKHLPEVENQDKIAKLTNSQDLHLTDLTITQAGSRRILQVSTARDPSSRLGLAAPPSASSVIWTPIKTSRKAPSANDPSINEIDSADFFNFSTTTTTKPNILWGIVPGPNNRVGGSEVEWLTTTTTIAPDTRVAVPEHPTSLTEFINAQLSLLMPMWTNLIKLTDHFGREIRDSISSVLDFLWELFVQIFSERKKRAIEWNMSEL